MFKIGMYTFTMLSMYIQAKLFESLLKIGTEFVAKRSWRSGEMVLGGG